MTYLGHVSTEQPKDLDGGIESTILRWLGNCKLGPAFFRIEAVSEHPVFSNTHAGFAKRSDDKGHVGESDYPLAR